MGAISRAARVCALVVVLTGTVLVASAQADVYWANAGTHTIGRANLDGTNPNPRWLGVYALDIAVSGGYLYYINVPGDSIGRVALDGGSSDPNLITGLNNPNGIAVTSSAIYWLSPGTGNLYKANLDGSNPTAIVTGITGGYDVVATSTNLYWSTGCISGTNPCNGWIGRSDLNGGSLTQTWVAGRAPFFLAADSGFIYSATSTGEINRTSISTKGTGPLVSALPTAVGVAQDGTHLYWSEGLAGGSSIGRANLDGTGQNPNFITGVSAVYGLAVDPSHTGPLVSQPPTLGGGTAEGQTLQESHGTWSGSPGSYTYQWQRCNASGAACSAISGATLASYTLGAADLGATLRVQETATNAYGSSVAATSSPSGVVQSSAPANTAPPTISGGTVTGDVLTEAPGAWTNIPTSYAYQWWRCNAAGAACAAVAGATAQGYALRGADVGSTIRVQEFATNVWGTGTSGLSPATGVIQAPLGPAPDDTSLTLSASPSLALVGKPVTLLAHVVDNTTPGVVPAGTVTFLAGKVTVGTAPVSSHGFASLTTKNLRGPEQSLTAVFNPAAGWAGSVSNVYDELIVPRSSIPAPKGCTRPGAMLPVHVTRAVAVKAVTYLIDGKRVAVSTHSPFSVRLVTKKLKHGKHRLIAVLTYHTSHGNVTRTLKGTFRIC